MPLPLIALAIGSVVRMVAPVVARQLIGKGVARKATQSAIKKATKTGKPIPRASGKQVEEIAKRSSSSVNKNSNLASNVTKASPRVKTPSSKGLDRIVKRADSEKSSNINPRGGLASIKKTPTVAKTKTPTSSPATAPSKLSPAGKVRAAKLKAQAAAKPKAKAAKTTTTNTNTTNPLSPASIASMIKKPSVRTATKVGAGVGAGAGAAYLLKGDSNKSSESTRKPKFDNTVNDEGTGALFKPEYDNTVDDEGTGAKLKPKKSKKKKDPDYKLYSGDLAKKYDLKYMTGEAMERDETKRIADGAKSGGHLKKLKHGGKVTKKSKGGFMGKGAGCARKGY